MGNTTLDVKMVDENGIPAPDFIINPWVAFLSGSWTRETPTKVGRYIIVNSVGRMNGEMLVHNEGGELKISSRVSVVHELTDGWDGWYWSEPFPTCLPSKLPMRQIMGDIMRTAKASASAVRPSLTLVPSEG